MFGLRNVNGQDFQDFIKKILSSSWNDKLALIALASSQAAVWIYHEHPVSVIAKLGLWSSATVAVASTALLLFRLVRTLFGRAPGNRPVTAVGARGLAPYTENDEELFWSLGRITEIRRLLSVVQDTRSAVVAVDGKAGVGKTSLVWAGLIPALRQRSINCAYCDLSATTDPVDAVSNAASIYLKEDASAGLERLSETSSRAVLIIDSFEELDLGLPVHGSFLALLRSLAKTPPPHTFQVLVIFRDDYEPSWLKIEEQTGIRAKRFETEALSERDATRSMEALLQELDVNVDRKIIREYIRGIVDNNRVSPLDIALGAQVFEKWAKQLEEQSLHFLDYAAAGGTFGVHFKHVQTQLENGHVFPADRPTLVRSLAHQFSGGKTAPSVTAEDVTRGTGLDFKRVSNLYLPDLSSEQSRILEQVPGTNPVEYKLTKPSYAAALRELDKVPTDESNRIKLFLEEKYDLWNRSQNNQDLLRGKPLKRAISQSDSLNLEITIRSYLNRSSRAQFWRRIRYVSISTSMLAIAVGIALFAGTYKQHTKLSSWLLPYDLYERQNSLTSLRIEGYSVTDLKWLKQGNFSKLEIIDARVRSVDGIRNPRTIEDLTLDLTGTPVESLTEIGEIPGLSKLRLSLGSSGVRNLEGLISSPKLVTLSLDLGGSSIQSLDEIGRMDQLKELTLRLAGSTVRNLAPLTTAKQLNRLTVDLDSSQLTMLDDLNDAVNLGQLTLNIENPRGRQKSKNDGYLPNLVGMEALRKLTINLSPPANPSQQAPELDQAPVVNLGSLVLPPGLQELHINIGGFPVQQLPRLDGLEHLHTLDLQLHGAHFQRLPNWAQLHQLRVLDISIDEAQVSSLNVGNLTQITNLTLAMQGAGIRTLPLLKRLTNLRNLALSVQQTGIYELSDLASLRELRNLELHLKWAQAQEIPALADLQHLENLAIYLFDRPVGSLPILKIQHNLKSLTLGLSGASLDRLPDLTQFAGVSTLFIYANGSDIQYLDSLAGVAGTLKTLVLDLSDTQKLRDLLDIGRLPILNEITLTLDGSQVQELPDLSGLKNLKRTTLSICKSQINDLAQVQHLPFPHEVTLDQRYESLGKLPRSIDRMTFAWRQ